MKLNVNKKLVIIFIIILVILVSVWLITYETIYDKVEKYIVAKDFKLNTENNLYEKNESKIKIDEYYDLVDNSNDASYGVLRFDTKEFVLFKEKLNFSNGISYVFDGRYNYKTGMLYYVYEISKENVSVLFDGTFNNNEFTCEVVDSDNINLFGNQSTFCELVKYEVDEFNEEIRETITSASLLEKMRK